jgi:hypothetical protein
MGDGYELIAGYESETEARAAVETLLLSGLGARYRSPQESASSEFQLQVVAGDGRRAREVLGLPAPEPSAHDRVVELRQRRPPWFAIVVIFLAALVVIPLVAFYVTFKLTGG